MKNIFFVDSNKSPYPDWEKAKIGDFSSLKNGYSFKSNSYKEDGNFSIITISNVTGEKYISGKNSKIREIPKDIQPHQILKIDDILISLTGNVGRVSLNNKYKNLLNQRVGLLNIFSENINKEYLLTCLRSDVFRDAMVNLGQGGAQPNISKSDIEDYEIPLPSLEEQQKIAEFFSALDERIDLQAQKVSLLKEEKKGYQQRVFNRELVYTDDNGEAYPEWEEKTLGEVAEFINGFAFKPEHLGDKGTTVVKIKELLDPSDLSVKTTIDIPESLHLTDGDIIFSWSMTLACKIWNAGKAYLNQHLYKVVVKDNVSSQFVNYLLNNEIPEIRTLMHGGTAKHITRKDLIPYKVKIPSLEEQTKIADFFSALDENIELNERKLELLKEQKKGYLQGIFG